jgi:uncharacterized membrane protein
VASTSRVTPKWWLVCAVLVASYAVYMSTTTVKIHRGLGTSAYDFGLYEQGVWLLSRFDSPFVTLMGRNLFGDHSSFILLFLVPFYWFNPSTSFLLVVQSVVIASGAVPLFWYALRRLQSGGAAMVIALGYLIHPAVVWTNLENFHPDCFLAPLIALIVVSAAERRWRVYWVAVVLALLVKEDVAFVLVPIGLFVALRGDRRRGLITAAASLGVMALMFFVVMRSFTGVAFRNSWRIPFGGVGGFLTTLVTRPWDVVVHLTSDTRPRYLWQVFAPLGFVAALAPSAALTALGVVGVNLLSTFWYQYQVQYHYSLVIVPGLAFATIEAFFRLKSEFRRSVATFVAGCSLVCAYFWVPLPFTRVAYESWSPSSPQVVATAELFAKIPADASLSAYHPLTAQLARRHEIYSFPNPFVRSLYGPDVFAKGDRLPAADTVAYVMLPTTLNPTDQDVWDAEASDFIEVARNSWWVLFARQS